tara:strand:- start:363 stop:590 length:228 start_codon:yes stop_codon:yes gene_type:complete
MKKLLFILLLSPLLVFSQDISIYDVNFEQAIIDLGFDNEIDGKLNADSVSKITSLNISNRNITTLDGIESFISFL